MNFAKLHDLLLAFFVAFSKDLGGVDDADEEQLQAYLFRYVNPLAIVIFNGLTRPGKKDDLFAIMSYYRGELRFERVRVKDIPFTGKPIEMPMVAVTPTLALSAKSAVVVAGVAFFQYIRYSGIEPEFADETEAQKWSAEIATMLLEGFNNPDDSWSMHFHYTPEPTAVVFKATIPLES